MVNDAWLMAAALGVPVGDGGEAMMGGKTRAVVVVRRAL